MGAPQIVMILLIGMNLGISMFQHGQPKTGKHNFFVTLVAIIIEVCILKAGGFF